MAAQPGSLTPPFFFLFFFAVWEFGIAKYLSNLNIITLRAVCAVSATRLTEDEQLRTGV
jgi:hypothetical protein